MPMEAYKAMKDTIESPDESVPFENVLNVAMLLFMNYVDAATDSFRILWWRWKYALKLGQGQGRVRTWVGTTLRQESELALQACC